jgi:uncharacterized membrane protein YcaP (DUF421 family)
LNQMFFSGWETLWRTLVIGVLAYVVLVLFLRVSGLRTLSKMNAFDLIVTVALGSTLATILLNRDVALAEGALAFALLIGLQYAVTWTSVRAQWVRDIVTGEPVMLLHDGELLPSALRRARVTEKEVEAAVRAAGMAGLDEARAVVLETDGSFSVVRRGTAAGRSSLESVRGPHEHRPSAVGGSNDRQDA